MKKTLLYMTISAFAAVTLIGDTTAHAQNTGASYTIVTQERAKTNCTTRNSDLGLGGGVFVAGTTFCEEQQPLMMIGGKFAPTHNRYAENYDYASSNNVLPHNSTDSYDSQKPRHDQRYQEDTPKNELPHTYKKTSSRTYSGTTKKTQSPANSSTKSGSHSW